MTHPAAPACSPARPPVAVSAPRPTCWCGLPEAIEQWGVIFENVDPARTPYPLRLHGNGTTWHVEETSPAVRAGHSTPWAAVMHHAIGRLWAVAEICSPARLRALADEAAVRSGAAVAVALSRDDARSLADHVVWLRGAPSALGTAAWVDAVDNALHDALDGRRR